MSNYEMQLAQAEARERRRQRALWRMYAWAWLAGMRVTRIQDAIYIEPANRTHP